MKSRILQTLFASLLAMLPVAPAPAPKRLYPEEWDRWAEIAVRSYGGDPMLLIAIACLESGYGKSRLAQTKNNFHGIKRRDGKGFQKFSDGVGSFVYAAWLMTRSKYYESCKSLYDIGRIYCPDDQDWSGKVHAIYRKIGGKHNLLLRLPWKNNARGGITE